MDWMRGLMPVVQEVARVSGIAVSTDLHDWDGVNVNHQPFAAAADWVFLSDVGLGQAGPCGAEPARSGRIRVITHFDEDGVGLGPKCDGVGAGATVCQGHQRPDDAEPLARLAADRQGGTGGLGRLGRSSRGGRDSGRTTSASASSSR
jgi:hypothetical protein